MATKTYYDTTNSTNSVLDSDYIVVQHTNSGTGYSSDLTQMMKTTIGSIRNGAQANVLEGISFKGSGSSSYSDLPITAKKAQLDLSAYVLNTRTINGNTLASNVTIDGSNAYLSPGYSSAISAAAPSIGDSIDTAVGKVQAEIEEQGDDIAEIQSAISGLSAGVTFKGEIAYASLPTPSASNTGWEYWVTDKSAFYISDGSSWIDVGATIIDNLESTDVNKALSANQGRILNERKAEIDGYYEDMTVGGAEQLISNITEDDDTVYSFRTSGGSVDIGDREDMVYMEGGTIAWNQVGKTWDNWDSPSGASLSISGDTLTATTTGTTLNVRQADIPYIVDHYYLYSVVVKCTKATDVCFGDGDSAFGSVNVSANTWTTLQFIRYGTASSTQMRVYVARSSDNLTSSDSVEMRYPNLFDLTAMFGSTIADYIYSLEQAHAGDGVAWFRRYFPKPYYAYCEPTLESVKPYSHVMTGFNQYDYSTGKARILGLNQTSNARYQITGAYTGLSFADLSGNAITVTVDSDGYFSTENECVLTITGGNNTDTCVHLVWDGEKDGDWEKYTESVYNFDSSLALRGVPTLVEKDGYSQKLLGFDGDEYYADGTVKRKYGIVTISEVSTGATQTNYYRGSFALTGAKIASSTILSNELIKPSVAINSSVIGDASYNPTFVCVSRYGNDTYLYIAVPNKTTKADLNTWLASNPIKVVYELATPTTASATPYTNPQVVSDWGTEEFVDGGVVSSTRDVSIPAGHFTKYQANLRAKLETAPNSPSEDGFYVVQREDGENTYVPAGSAILPWVEPIDREIDDLQSKHYTTSDITYPSQVYGKDTVPAVDKETVEVKTLYGKTRAWNQLIPDNKISYTFTVSEDIPSAQWGASFMALSSLASHVGHKVLACRASHSDKFYIAYGNDASVFTSGQNIAYGDSLAGIYDFTNSFVQNSGSLYIRYLAGLQAGTYTINIHLYDLTLIFGSGNEPATVADALAQIPALGQYNAYDAGSLVDTEVSGVRSVGKNLLDNVDTLLTSVGFTKTDGVYYGQPNLLYNARLFSDFEAGQYTLSVNGRNISSSSASLAVTLKYSDGTSVTSPIIDTNYSRTITRTSDASKKLSDITFTFYNNIDIAINWMQLEKGSTGTSYSPYKTDTLSLPETVTLRSAGSVADELDVESGVITREVGIVDLSTLTWSNYDTNGHITNGLQSLIKPSATDATVGNIVHSIYEVIASSSSLSVESTKKTIAVNSAGTLIYTDGGSSETSPTGYLCYELKAPTTESIDPVPTNSISVEANGSIRTIQTQTPAIDNCLTITASYEVPYVKVADLVNDLTTSATNRALAANQGKVLDEKKADKDGYYKNLGAGTAEQLISTVFTEDKVPYNFRTAGGAIDIGDREEDEIEGGSIAWNQLVEKTNLRSRTTYNVTITPNNDGSITISTDGTAEETTALDILNTAIPSVVGHKYLNLGSTSSLKLETADSLSASIFSATSATQMLKLRIIQGQVYSGKIYPQFIDLTQMFGSQIADYIYNLETGNAGAGVAWFRKLFPKPYYAYNAGSLESVCVGAHNTTGFNQWDEEWEVGGINSSTGQNIVTTSTIRTKNYIPVIPSTTYFINSNKWQAMVAYDANKNYLGTCHYSSTSGGYLITIPSDCYYIRWAFYNYGTTYNHDICINLHWDGERDGEYEPYVLNSYALDHTKTLRGIPKLDANNKLYYDGDVYKSDGTVERRYGVVDLGTLTWTQIANYDWGKVYGSKISDIHNETGYYVNSNIISSKYATHVSNDTNPNNSEYLNCIYQIVQSSTYNIGVCLSTSSSTSDISGYLVYELATPTTESADPYTNPQIVNDFGTEEYVDYPESQGTRDVAIPVGHNTKYQPNLRAKLEMAPDSPDGDGYYVVQQDSGENIYVDLSGVPAISNLNTRVPACATGTDGTFVLKATVSGGAVTYSWVAQS